MALRYEDVLRCKKERGYNIVGVGAEAYSVGGYAAVFDRAIEPYLVDVGTTSISPVTGTGCATAVPVILASNPPLVGVTNQQLTFVQGSEVVVDVGPLQESSTILAIVGLSATLLLSGSHGAYGSYPVLLLGAAQFVRNIFKRLDILAEQLRAVAPLTAGVEKASTAVLSAAEKGRRGRKRKRLDS